MKKSPRLLGFTAALAAILFAIAFRGEKKNFWNRMTGVGIREIFLGLTSAAAPVKLS